jgi:uncharacterized protein YkwD
MQRVTRIFVAATFVSLVVPAHDPAVYGRTPCNGATAIPTSTNLAQVERSTLCLINAQRRAHGLGPVRSNRLLRRAALRHSREMVRQHYFGHTSRDGSDFVARIREAGYFLRSRFWHAGENLAWGIGLNSAPGAIVRAWMNSPPHRQTILTPDFRSVGVGVVPGTPRSGVRGATYTTDFGYRKRVVSGR